MAGKLHPVPETPPRAVLYLRQSISRDDSISLELQESACRAYCTQRGYQVVRVESDPGISGRTWNRPAVKRVLDMIESSEADVIVLWKWSRISRSRRDWALAADRVDVAGGRIESATEQVDVGTATGRLTRGMLVELAAFESDRIGEVWKEVHGSRLARGLLPGGQARYGYRIVPDSPVQVPDPETSLILRRMYVEYVAGHGFRTISRRLNDEGLRTMRGKLWKGESVIDVLDSGFGAGFVRWGGVLHSGAHEAVIDEALWAQYQDRREVTRTTPSRSKGSRYLLTGMVRCGRCGGNMRATPNNPRRQSPSFRCTRRVEHGTADRPGGCDGGATAMPHIERAVLEWLREYAARVESEAEVESRSLAVRVSLEGERTKVTAAIEKLDQQMQNLTLQLAEGVVPADAYAAVRDDLLARRATKVERLEEIGRETRASSVDRQQVAADLVQGWDVLPLEIRQRMLHDLIDHVVVMTSPKAPRTRAGAHSIATIAIVGVGEHPS
jgi:site-specific DNA recombinase